MEFNFTEENLQRLRDKYNEEIRRDPSQDGSAEENPIRTCMRIMFEAASQKNPSRRSDLAFDLSQFLTRPDGLINLFLAVIDFDPSSQIQTTHNQRFMAVANIVAFLPKLCLPYVQYCENLSRQLIPLVTHQDARYSSLSCLIVKSLLESPHAKKCQTEVQKVLLNLYTSPLKEKNADLSIHSAILGIHHLISNRLSPKVFVDLFTNLLCALVELYKSPSQLKSHLTLIIIEILRDLKPGPACCLIEQTLFHTSKVPVYNLVAEDEMITLELVEESGLMPTFDSLNELMLKILEEADEELLTLEYFFHFQAKMWTSGDTKKAQKCALLFEPLLEHTVQEDPSHKLDLLSSIIANQHRALDLLSRVLLNYLEFIRLHKDRNRSFSNSLNSCLDLLEVLTSNLGTYDSQILNTLIEIESLLSPEESQSIHSLIDNWTCKPERQIKSVGLASPEYDEAMKDLNNHLVPVRVHALVKLKNLILTGDHYTVMRIPHLFNLVESSLADQESYVFLASIDLISEMALRKTKELLPKLMSLYTNNDLEVQQRINVGEVLVRLTRKMNGMTPFYAQQVIASFLAVAKLSDQELVRMSSLTNLGEICRNLGDSLGKYLVEILSCVEDTLKSDTLQVKCASIELLRLALIGLDVKTVESAQREMISVYKLLKKQRNHTIDETFCLQVNLALEEIDRLAKEMLGCSVCNTDDKLVKNIKIRVRKSDCGSV